MGLIPGKGVAARQAGLARVCAPRKNRKFMVIAPIALTWRSRRRQMRPGRLAAMTRILFAALMALAVALAPVGSALAAHHAVAKPAMQDCHGKASKDHSSSSKDHASSKDHSCCDPMAKCPDSCGVKCCKLMGVIDALPIVQAWSFLPPEVSDPQKPPDWQLRPRPPPPRS